MTRSGYAFSNAAEQSAVHHDALAELLDDRTRELIGEVLDLPGRRCLDVGTGAGSVAVWLAERAGAVLATDVAPRPVPERPGLEVRQHDIVTGGPLGRFDLVHARLLLGHLPGRAAALERMVEALAPGGVLVTGDFTVAPGAFVMSAPDEKTADVLSRYLTAHVRTLTAHGYDNNWSHRAPAAFEAAGLTEVHFRSYATSWRGGGPGCRLLRAGIAQLGVALVGHGFTEQDVSATAAALDDPRVLLNGFLFAQTCGRAPARRD
jgi:2-polyprenyl-3-methyl-5-hydroxy-6-metoxy-1,4-benzoquinol methylase